LKKDLIKFNKIAKENYSASLLFYNYIIKFLYYVFPASGLKFAFDVKTTLNISDITFYPSQTTHSYDIYASSIDKEDILFLDLTTGETILYYLYPNQIYIYIYIPF